MENQVKLAISACLGTNSWKPRGLTDSNQLNCRIKFPHTTLMWPKEWCKIYLEGLVLHSIPVQLFNTSNEFITLIKAAVLTCLTVSLENCSGLPLHSCEQGHCSSLRANKVTFCLSIPCSCLGLPLSGLWIAFCWNPVLGQLTKKTFEDFWITLLYYTYRRKFIRQLILDKCLLSISIMNFEEPPLYVCTFVCDVVMGY